jgi:hypothetical protein
METTFMADGRRMGKMELFAHFADDLDGPRRPGSESGDVQAKQVFF